MGTLTIYTKPSGCFACNKTKEKFAAADVDFTEVDVTTTPSAREYVAEELGFTQVPVVVFEQGGSENIWFGLNPGKIEQVINILKSAA